MLDIKFIRENPDKIRRAAEVKRIDCDVEELLRVDEELRSSLHAIEQLRAGRNAGSKQIPRLDGEEKTQMIA